MMADSQNLLFVKYQPMLREYVFMLVGNYADAEDLCQDISLEILSSKTAPETAEHFGPWARGLARNVVCTFWRSKKRATALNERFMQRLELACAEADKEVDLWVQRRSALQQCLATLPEKSQELLRQRYDSRRSRMAPASGADRNALMRVRRALVQCIEKRTRMAES